MHTPFSLENLKKRDLLEDLAIERRKLSQWILEKWDVKVWN
jgi:hypothetical protein